MRKLLIGLGISAGCLWWAFRNFDWAAVKDALLASDLMLIGIASGLLLLSIPIRGYRWGILLQPVGRVGLRLTSEATLVGYFGNNALPFRLGEVLRSHFLAKQGNMSMSSVFGTVIVERVIDTLGFMLVIVIMPLIGAVPSVLRQPMVMAMIVGGVLAIGLAIVVKMDRVPFVTGRLEKFLGKLKIGFDALREDSHYIPLIITTLAIWGLYITSVYVGLSGMGLELSLAQSYLVLIGASLVMAIPAAPGFVGTYHASVIFILTTVFGIALAPAQAAAIVLHAVGFLPYTIFGAIFYFKSHLYKGAMPAVLTEAAEKVSEEV